jgi:TRAP-type uncharacterized transport system fused permease subunit
VRLGAAGFLLPFMFVFGPQLLLLGTTTEIVFATVTCAVGVSALAAAFCGFLLRPLHLVERLLLGVAALTLMHPGGLTDLVGVSLSLLVGVIHWWRHRKMP